MRNYSYENDFDLHENETARRTHFHMNGFAPRLVLKQRHKRTQKWPIPLFKLKPISLGFALVFYLFVLFSQSFSIGYVNSVILNSQLS